MTPRGRPRDARADEAILHAALEVLVEGGFAGFSMELVASRAKVGKATIYRRWPSREQLIVHAMRTLTAPVEVPDTGSLRGDLEAFMDAVLVLQKATQASDVLPQLIAAAAYDDTLRESLDDYVRERQRPVRAILDRAIARGELDRRTDVEVLVDLLMGALFYRRVLTHEPIDRRYAVRLVDHFLDYSDRHSSRRATPSS